MSKDKKNKENIQINVVEKITDLITPVVEEMGLELVDVEYLQDGGYWYVRIYIEYLEKEISLEDCALFSGKVEENIDKLIEQKFFLEVSSPGIERPLKKVSDFIRFKGEKIKVTLKHKKDDKKAYEGKIVSCNADILVVNDGNQDIFIEYKEIKKANLKFEF
ncbi:ribosome maturation factor RimP [Fusobacterium sp. PH5-44]|uniref:ribosome maturation factor RimP n=1 Tax=unclassified Fusobacterium TaxID=2648384 RepID=UPI003D191D32